MLETLGTAYFTVAGFVDKEDNVQSPCQCKHDEELLEGRSIVCDRGMFVVTRLGAECDGVLYVNTNVLQ